MKMPASLGMLRPMKQTSPRLMLGLTLVSLVLAGCGTMRRSIVVEPAAASVRSNQAITGPATRARAPGGSYVVIRGDTLYSIAFRNGVDFRDLAQWNRIASPYTIWPGQRLVLSPSASAPATRPAAASGHTHRAPAAVAPPFEPVSRPASPASSGTSPPATVATAEIPVAGVTVPAPAALPPPAPAAAGVSRVVSGVQWRWPADGQLVGRFKSGDAMAGIEIAGKSGDPIRAAADGVVVYSGNGLVGYGELVIIKHSDSFLSAYGHNRKRLVKEGQRVTAGQQVAEMGSTGTTRNELEFQIRKDGNPVDPLGYLPPR